MLLIRKLINIINHFVCIPVVNVPLLSVGDDYYCTIVSHCDIKFYANMLEKCNISSNAFL